MDTIKKQMNIAGDILHQLEIIHPYAVLAGGAPRDWYLGTPANDLDFYFYSSGGTVSSVKKQLDTLFGTDVFKSKRLHVLPMYKTMKNIVRIWEGIIEGLQVQLIQLVGPKDTFSVVDQFSCSICKAWWLGGDKIQLEDTFIKSLISGTILISDGYTRECYHVKKMIDRFGKDFSFTTDKDLFDKRVIYKSISDYRIGHQIT